MLLMPQITMIIFFGILQYWSPKSEILADTKIKFPGIKIEKGKTIVLVLKYEFEVNQYESQKNRLLVEVFNEAQTKKLTSLLVFSDYRSEDRNGVLVFYKTRKIKHRVVKSWWYPGNLWGYQFVYSKKRAKEIVKETGEYVLALDGDDFEKSKIVAILPNGAELQLDP